MSPPWRRGTSHTEWGTPFNSHCVQNAYTFMQFKRSTRDPRRETPAFPTPPPSLPPPEIP